MRPPLTVQNAQIQTAAVEVKTLTISGKQVTLAVFRQLLERPLVLEDGTLAGTPWGMVNYHPDKCATGVPMHRHVVWQTGNELRRAKVDRPAWGVRDAFWSEFADDFVSAGLCLEENHQRPRWLTKDLAGDEFVFTLDDLRCCANGDLQGLHWKSDHVCATQEEYNDLRGKMVVEVAEEKARRQRHRDAWALVLDLPQLFIAV